MQQYFAFSVIICLVCIITNVISNTQKCKNQHRIHLPLTISNFNKQTKPNIVLILTDDQDIELGSMNFMPRVQHLLKSEGAEFRNAYTTTPMCCPSRSSILTGQYMHNHHVYTNNENCSSPYWRKFFENKSFATYVQKSGYKTAYFGKYLNKYNGSHIPVGWDHWSSLVMNSKYYNYTINTNGKKIQHFFDYSKDYYSDLMANESIAFMKDHFSKNDNLAPLMMVMSFPAPHGPEDSAPQYSHMFFNVTTHHTPAYNLAPNPGKQWILQKIPQMSTVQKLFTNILMTKRLQTLQSVDIAVERIYKTLDSFKQLENTFIFYMSDHGYHLGQFGLVKGKSFPFEFDVRIPFLVRGPGIKPGIIINDIVLNIDIAPTFLSIAGINAPKHMDGKPILKFYENCPNKKLRNKLKWRDSFLIESSGRRNNKDYEMKVKSIIEEEIDYDSQHANKIPLRSRNKFNQLSFDCQNSDDLQLPCRPMQKWYCNQEENGKWRKRKCKFNHVTNSDSCTCLTNNIVNNSNDVEQAEIYNKMNSILFPRHKFVTTDNVFRNYSCHNKINCILKQSINDENTLIESQYYVDKVIFQLKKKLSNWRKVSRILSRLRKWKNITNNFNFSNRTKKCDCKKRKIDLFLQQKKQKKFTRKLKLGNCLKQGMNCFIHDSNHWKTEPLWQLDPFCFCTNAANNSYLCLRTINRTHNFLYCEFVTKFVTFYDLKTDRFQKVNKASQLPQISLMEFHNKLGKLKDCKGDYCT